VYRFLWLLPKCIRENSASGSDFPVGGQGDDFLLLTSGLHQKTIKCHRPTIACHDQYDELAFVMVGRSVFVVFALLSIRWQIAVASLLSFSFVLRSFFCPPSFLLIVLRPGRCKTKNTALHVNSFLFMDGLWKAVCMQYCASGKAK